MYIIILHFTKSLKIDNTDILYLWMQEEHNCDVTGQKFKPGTCRHLSFATNPVLSNFIGKINFFVQFHIFAPNCSETIFFGKIKQI